MTQTELSTGAQDADRIDRAAAALSAAQREAHAAIDHAVHGLASAYGDSQPLFARIGRNARDYVQDGLEAARHSAQGLRERSQRAVDSTRDHVRDEPLKSLLVAAAVGAAVIALVEVVRHRRYR